jgi:recombination protein RecT
MGMLHLAQQTGAIQWGKAVLVREGDVFELTGIAKEPIHKFNPFSKDRNTQPVVGVYSVVKTDTGDFLTECMSIEEVHEIRNRSSAWKAWLSKKAKCPWVTDEGEMTKKTCLKRAAKTWPRRERLDNAIHHLNTDGNEGMAQEKDITPITEDQITVINDMLQEMSKTFDDLAKALSTVFKRTISIIDDLSQDEAAKAIAIVKTQLEKVRATA